MHCVVKSLHFDARTFIFGSFLVRNAMNMGDSWRFEVFLLRCSVDHGGRRLQLVLVRSGSQDLEHRSRPLHGTNWRNIIFIVSLSLSQYTYIYICVIIYILYVI